MTTVPRSPTEATALRHEMLRYGIALNQTTARNLLRAVGNYPLCVDALLMAKRPEWLKTILDPVAKSK